MALPEVVIWKERNTCRQKQMANDESDRPGVDIEIALKYLEIVLKSIEI